MKKYLIKDGLIYDGSGGAPYRGDILTAGGRIVRIAAGIRSEDAEPVDASRRVVTPGFVDIHRHCDFAAMKDGFGLTELAQGITTAAAGNCGLSAVPRGPRAGAEYLTYIEPCLGAAAPDTPSSFGEYISFFETKKLKLNLGFFIGTGAIRVAVKGFDASPFTRGELEAARSYLEDALDRGALGVSVGIMYIPECYNRVGDYVAMLEPAAKKNAPVAVHVRGEGDGLTESVKEALRIGKESGAPIHISHFKSAGANNWNRQIHTAIDEIEKARGGGQDVTVDFYPYERGQTTLATMLPPSFVKSDLLGAIRSLADKKNIETLRRELAQDHPGWDNFAKTLGWERIIISSVSLSHNEQYVGKTVADNCAAYGFEDGVEFVARLLADEEGKVAIINMSMCREDVDAVAKLPYSFVISDSLYSESGAPHPRLNGSFPKILREYVAERKVLSLEQAVNKMTLLPARRIGADKKGFVGEGFDADLLIFDPLTFKDNATYADPKARATGLFMSFVSGAIAVRGDAVADGNNGKLLRRAK